jgi:hypothetical protein
MTYGRAGLLVTVVLIGCTTPNPRSCKDGLCTDQRFPFCDVDGALEGQPETCIEVACTPGEVIACRDDTALRCNTTGNDYDLLQCERGCDAASGCRGCTADDQCSNPTPVCDEATTTCRGCATDDDCASTICNTSSGACLPEADVVFASATGAESGACARVEPCSLTRAVTVATTAGRPLVKMLPGTYAQSLVVDTLGAQPLVVLAAGAILGPSSGVRVTNGLSLELRGIEIRSASSGSGIGYISCGDVTPGAPRTSLTIEDAKLSVSSPSNMVVAGNCSLRMRRVEFEDGSPRHLYLVSDTDFDGDRLSFGGSTGAALNALGKRIHVRLTNSVADDRAILMNYSDDVSPGSSFYLAFNTFANTQVSCGYQGTTNPIGDVQYENNIIYGPSFTDAVYSEDVRCTLTNNVIYPQQTPRPNNINADPQFVNAAGGDFHLLATSPAIDAAMPSAGLDPAFDFEGTARPQGAAKDIGAFERTP